MAKYLHQEGLCLCFGRGFGCFFRRFILFVSMLDFCLFTCLKLILLSLFYCRECLRMLHLFIGSLFVLEICHKILCFKEFGLIEGLLLKLLLVLSWFLVSDILMIYFELLLRMMFSICLYNFGTSRIILQLLFRNRELNLQ